MELRYLFQLVRDHWRFITVLTVVATVMGLLGTYIISEDYEASTKILIRPSKEMTFGPTSKEMMDYPVGYNIPVESISKTYAEIMSSEAVAAKVVAMLHLDTWKAEPDPRWYVRALYEVRDWVKISAKYTWEFMQYGTVKQKDPYWAAVERVQDGLKAEPVEETYIFTLTATMGSPDLAARVADTAASVFVDYSRSARQGEEGTAAAFISESLDNVRLELEGAREKLALFRERTQAASLDEEISLKLDAMARFEAQTEEARKDLQEVDAEVTTLRNQIDELSEEVHASTTLEKNPVLQQLQSDWAVYKVELAGLLETHTEAHPRVQTLTAKIEESKARMEAEFEQVRSSDTTVLNPIYQELEQRFLDRRVQQDALMARMAALGETTERYQLAINELTYHKNELARLTLEVEILEDSYKMVSHEYEEARMASAQAISEIRVLHNAIPPVYPSRPIKVYYAGGGLIAGLLVALGLVLLRDYVDHRIRTQEDLEEAFGIPVLVSVPHAELPARSAALLAGPGASSARLSWRMLSGDIVPIERNDDDTKG